MNEQPTIVPRRTKLVENKAHALKQHTRTHSRALTHRPTSLPHRLTTSLPGSRSDLLPPSLFQLAWLGLAWAALRVLLALIQPKVSGLPFDAHCSGVHVFICSA